MTRNEINHAIDDALEEHDCEYEGEDKACSICDGLDEASDELTRAEQVIESLKHGECWCDRSDGHTPTCIEAQRFMENA